MRAVVVYESFWGNTAAVARAIAEGIGADATPMTTDQATPDVVASADLLVVGGPVMVMRLPTDNVREKVGSEVDAPVPADTAHPSLRSWLDALPTGHGRGAAFETRLRWSPGGATGAINRGLEGAGFRTISKGQKFVVTGKFGPLQDGELDRARQWGAALASAAQDARAS
jgi:hypothetical protein